MATCNICGKEIKDKTILKQMSENALNKSISNVQDKIYAEIEKLV